MVNFNSTIEAPYEKFYTAYDYECFQEADVKFLRVVIMLNSLKFLIKSTAYMFSFFLLFMLPSIATADPQWVKVEMDKLQKIYESGDNVAALSKALRLLPKLKKELGADHRAVAMVSQKLVGLYKRTKQYKKGVPYSKEAIRITLKNMGNSSLMTAVMYLNHASLVSSIKRQNEAIASYKSALVVCLN